MIDYEVYGYDKDNHQTLEVCYTLPEAKKTAAKLHKEGLLDVRLTKLDEDTENGLVAAWEYKGKKLMRVE